MGVVMNWYVWDTLEEFNNWHDPLCVELGYPVLSVNQLTGVIDENAQPTIAYTSVMEVDGKWIGLVEDKYAEGLTQIDYIPPLPDHITGS